MHTWERHASITRYADCSHRVVTNHLRSNIFSCLSCPHRVGCVLNPQVIGYLFRQHLIGPITFLFRPHLIGHLYVCDCRIDYVWNWRLLSSFRKCNHWSQNTLPGWTRSLRNRLCFWRRLPRSGSDKDRLNQPSFWRKDRDLNPCQIRHGGMHSPDIARAKWSIVCLRNRCDS